MSSVPGVVITGTPGASTGSGATPDTLNKPVVPSGPSGPTTSIGPMSSPPTPSSSPSPPEPPLTPQALNTPTPSPQPVYNQAIAQANSFRPKGTPASAIDSSGNITYVSGGQTKDQLQAQQDLITGDNAQRSGNTGPNAAEITKAIQDSGIVYTSQTPNFVNGIITTGGPSVRDLFVSDIITSLVVGYVSGPTNDSLKNAVSDLGGIGISYNPVTKTITDPLQAGLIEQQIENQTKGGYAGISFGGGGADYIPPNLSSILSNNSLQQNYGQKALGYVTDQYSQAQLKELNNPITEYGNIPNFFDKNGINTSATPNPALALVQEPGGPITPQAEVLGSSLGQVALGQLVRNSPFETSTLSSEASRALVYNPPSALYGNEPELQTPPSKKPSNYSVSLYEDLGISTKLEPSLTSTIPVNSPLLARQLLEQQNNNIAVNNAVDKLSTNQLILDIINNAPLATKSIDIFENISNPNSVFPLTNEETRGLPLSLGILLTSSTIPILVKSLPLEQETISTLEGTPQPNKITKQGSADILLQTLIANNGKDLTLFYNNTTSPIKPINETISNIIAYSKANMGSEIAIYQQMQKSDNPFIKTEGTILAVTGGFGNAVFKTTVGLVGLLESSSGLLSFQVANLIKSGGSTNTPFSIYPENANAVLEGIAEQMITGPGLSPGISGLISGKGIYGFTQSSGNSAYDLGYAVGDIGSYVVGLEGSIAKLAGIKTGSEAVINFPTIAKTSSENVAEVITSNKIVLGEGEHAIGLFGQTIVKETNPNSGEVVSETLLNKFIVSRLKPNVDLATNTESTFALEKLSPSTFTERGYRLTELNPLTQSKILSNNGLEALTKLNSNGVPILSTQDAAIIKAGLESKKAILDIANGLNVKLTQAENLDLYSSSGISGTTEKLIGSQQSAQSSSSVPGVLFPDIPGASTGGVGAIEDIAKYPEVNRSIGELMSNLKNDDFIASELKSAKESGDKQLLADLKTIMSEPLIQKGSGINERIIGKYNAIMNEKIPTVGYPWKDIDIPILNAEKTPAALARLANRYVITPEGLGFGVKEGTTNIFFGKLGISEPENSLKNIFNNLSTKALRQVTKLTSETPRLAKKGKEVFNLLTEEDESKQISGYDTPEKFFGSNLPENTIKLGKDTTYGLNSQAVGLLHSLISGQTETHLEQGLKYMSSEFQAGLKERLSKSAMIVTGKTFRVSKDLNRAYQILELGARETYDYKFGPIKFGGKSSEKLYNLQEALLNAHPYIEIEPKYPEENVLEDIKQLQSEAKATKELEKEIRNSELQQVTTGSGKNLLLINPSNKESSIKSESQNIKSIEYKGSVSYESITESSTSSASPLSPKSPASPLSPFSVFIFPQKTEDKKKKELLLSLDNKNRSTEGIVSEERNEEFIGNSSDVQIEGVYNRSEATLGVPTINKLVTKDYSRGSKQYKSRQTDYVKPYLMIKPKYVSISKPQLVQRQSKKTNQRSNRSFDKLLTHKTKNSEPFKESNKQSKLSKNKKEDILGISSKKDLFGIANELNNKNYKNNTKDLFNMRKLKL